VNGNDRSQQPAYGRSIYSANVYKLRRMKLAQWDVGVTKDKHIFLLLLFLLLLLVFCCSQQSMTPMTWQVAVDDEEQRPLLQDILKAAVDGHHVIFQVTPEFCYPSSASKLYTLWTVQNTWYPPNTTKVKRKFLDSEGGSQKATLVVLLVLGISSPKIPKVFLIHSGAQRNCIHIRADIPHRSTVSNFSHIF